MASISDKNTSYLNLSDSNYEFENPLLFWLFLIFDIPAVFCSLFSLYHLLTERSLREALHNHPTIIILLFNLVYQLVDIPLHLQYFKTGIIRPTNSTLCLFWLFIDYGFYFINLVVLMWASFERHILIFHSSMMATQRKRFFIHFVPLFIIVSFLMIFYGIAIFSPPCQNTFDFTKDLCGMAGCYGSIPSFALIERIAFAIIPMFLIIIFNIGLLVRIVWQKHRLHRPVEWQKQKKLAINLVSISLVYLCFDGPLTMINLVRLCGKSNWASDPWPIFFYISYFPILLLPMVCLGSSSELRNKLIPFHSRQHRRVAVLATAKHT
ncbi:unnamed protein product [Adineta steineri]|uniref:G-protein coupled receptors family 1 profile domain-containing protein n=1 Tax=Adineta steineri TaxID=433720 RepID=A0A818WLT5_9BILA|nr:unnamed protein product [Adineta steineri]CAF3727268.1 unnamed protein product [Adineta steineri]